MILCNSNRLQTFVTCNFNAFIGPKCFKNHLHLTTIKLNESDSDDKIKSDRKVAKLKLLQKLSKTTFTTLEDNILTKKDLKPQAQKVHEYIELEKQVKNKRTPQDIEERLAKYINKNDVNKTTEDLRTPLKNFIEKEKKNQAESRLKCFFFKGDTFFFNFRFFNNSYQLHFEIDQ